MPAGPVVLRAPLFAYNSCQLRMMLSTGSKNSLSIGHCVVEVGIRVRKGRVNLCGTKALGFRTPGGTIKAFPVGVRGTGRCILVGRMGRPGVRTCLVNKQRSVAVALTTAIVGLVIQMHSQRILRNGRWETMDSGQICLRGYPPQL